MELLRGPLPVVPRMAEEDVPKFRQLRQVSTLLRIGVSASTSEACTLRTNWLATSAALRCCRTRRSGRPRCSPTSNRTGPSMKKTSKTGSCYNRGSHHSGHGMQGMPLQQPMSDDLLLVLYI